MSDKSKYEKIPVHYCTTCLSLKIIVLENSTVDYCGDCGNSEISKAKNETWEELWKNKHGKYFINK